MGLQELHNRCIERTYVWRATWYGPLVRILLRLGVTANGITAARILFVIPLAYYLFFQVDLRAALVFYILFWLVDTIDGSVARATGTANDRGKFFDVLVDNFMYSFVIIGFIYLEAAPAPLLSYHILIQLVVYVLGIIYAQEGRPTDWIIKPQAEQQYNKILAHIILALYVFGIDGMRIGFILLNTWMTLQSVYLVRRIMIR